MKVVLLGMWSLLSSPSALVAGHAAWPAVADNIPSVAYPDTLRPKFGAYQFVAHRGGICEGIFEEYDPASLKAAMDSGYWMLEIDVRATKDSVLIVNHHDLLTVTYGLQRKVSEMTYAELQKVRSIRGDYSPMLFEDVLRMMKARRVRIQVDLKLEKPVEWYNRKVNEQLKRQGMLEEAFFIRNDVSEFYEGGLFGFRMAEVEAMRKRMAAGEDIRKKYYLFDHGNRLNAETVRWCQKNGIMVCASVNFGHYMLEEPTSGARRDIEYLRRSGVRIFQIDSDFDAYFD